MKKLIIIVLLFSTSVYSQKHIINKLYVEVKDTIQTKYIDIHTGDFEIKDFYLTQIVRKDSVGFDSIRKTRLFYWTRERRGSKFKKIYLPIKLDEIITVEKL